MCDQASCLDIVLLYAPPWSGPTRFSKHHLATYYAARGARVLYIEAPLTPVGVRRGSRFVAELGAALQPPRQVADRLWARRHFVPVPYHAVTSLTSRRAANRIGQRLLAPVIRRDLQRLGFGRSVLIAGLPHAVDVVPYLPWRSLVYHCADDYASVRGFPSTLPEMEAELCRAADLVVTTSESLCRARSRFNPNTHWIANAADVDHFSQTVPPAPDLREMSRPIVGFVGGLSEWVDLDLVAHIARERPEWSLALIGPVAIDTTPLRNLPNVRLLGPRPYVDLPGYLAAMDVGLIPFKDNPLTQHADPIKAYEYLAAGLPVVGAELPALRRLSQVIRLANSHTAFVRQLDEAIEAGRDAGRSARQQEAARHTWTARFDHFDDLVRATLSCAS